MSEESPCLQFLRKMLAAIEERSLGEQTSSVSHKGRSVQFSDISLDQMVRLYRQRLYSCPEAQAAGLPDLKDLNAPVGKRGRPARFIGRGHL